MPIMPIPMSSMLDREIMYAMQSWLSGYSHGYLSVIYGSMVKIDESYRDRAVFIIQLSSDQIWYDYDKHQAWCRCYRIKSKKKLADFRQACNSFINISIGC